MSELLKNPNIGLINRSDCFFLCYVHVRLPKIKALFSVLSKEGNDEEKHLKFWALMKKNQWDSNPPLGDMVNKIYKCRISPLMALGLRDP